MEAYNELLSEFHHHTAPTNFIADYKRLASQLAHSRQRKQAHLAAKHQQLRQLLPARTSPSPTPSPTASLHHHLSPQASGETLELRKEMGALQVEMCILKERSQQITSELSVLCQREPQVEQSGKDSGLSVLGQCQQLLIEANLAARQEQKQQHLLDSLTQRKLNLQREIQLLAVRQKHQQQLQQRWQRNRTYKLATTRASGMPLTQLETMLRVLFLLCKLAEQPQGASFDCEAQEAQLPEWQSYGSKRDVIAYYAELGVTADNMDVNTAVGSYRRQEEELDRWERASQQASSSLQTLQETYDQLSDQLLKLHAKKDKQAMHTLKMREASMKSQQQAFSRSCAFLAVGLSRLSGLVRKLQAFRHTLRRILRGSSDDLWFNAEPDSPAAEQLQTLLNRNPEELQLEWNGQPDKQTFFHFVVEKNDLLRLLARAELYDPLIDALTNYQNITERALNQANQMIQEMFAKLRSHLALTRKTVQDQHLSIRSKTEIAAVDIMPFCVESREYFRRDNYRLLQKLEKDQLRKRGLLVQLPLNLCLETELLPQTRQTAPLPVPSRHPLHSQSRQLMKYTDLATKRQQRSLKTGALRKMLATLTTLGSSRSTVRLPKPPLLNCTLNTGSSLRQSRNTVGHCAR